MTPSLKPTHTDIVIYCAILNGELTVKRLFTQSLLVQLRPANRRDLLITVITRRRTVLRRRNANIP